MNDLIVGLYEDWLWLDERFRHRQIEEISRNEANCRRLMNVLGGAETSPSDVFCSLRFDCVAPRVFQ
ncbi:hypothetical protein [Mesorhizobium sp. ORM16]|uniref:hypothetical protein n=1 Tax=Mesorhizobium sp. ORM16 TaxID=3376989 RepID=UPI00385723E5